MKKTLILCMLAISHLSISQSTTNLKVSESTEYKDKVKSIDVIAIRTSKSGETGIVRNAKRDLLFDIFDNKLNKTFTKVVESSKKESYVGDLFYNNQIKLFTVYAQKKDERILYCHTLDLSSKAYTRTLIFKATVEKKQSLFGSRKNHNTSFSLSPNGKYFAIATDNVRKNKNAYTIRVFDAETEKLIYKKAYQENEKRTFKHNDLYIDNNSNVYSLGKLFLNGKSNKKFNGDANYQFVLNKITKDENTELVIDLKDEHIQSLSISQTNNQLHLLGFYSELNVGRIKGGCDFVIDTNNFSIKTNKAQALPKQVYKDLYGYRTAKRKNKKKKELRNFDIDYVLTDSKGGTFLIAEEFYITQTYVQTGNAGGYYQTIYHYDDVLILKFSPSGDLTWGRSIFKRANSPSYNAFIKNDQLHVILNSGKNLAEKKDGRTKVSKGWLESSSLYDFEYSKNGDVSYNKIQDNRRNTFYLPGLGTYEMDKFIMMSEGRKKKTFMILE
ncbi:hypothetical protein [Lacinutrix jangbogonensis]|uniref:hypothetical protein n=1 Tax=Lacinutrix jangbogonensis TaxID=1469557 RepID=UPI00053E2DF0|nr:hypothetical protein [Lacinutrix jangbogonensis]